MKNKPKKIQSRTWGLILPCEWESCMQIVFKAKTLAKHYYWVRHDRDFYGDSPDDSESSHVPGELKKPHIHLLFSFNSSRDLGTVRNYFQEFPELKENSFEKIANAYGAKRYLVHADNPEKAQYKPEEVETSDNRFKDVFIEKLSSADEVQFIKEKYYLDGNETLFEYIDKHASLLANLTTYGKFIVIRSLRVDWYRLNGMRKIKDKREAYIHNMQSDKEISDGYPFY